VRKMIFFVLASFVVVASHPVEAQKPGKVARIGFLALTSGATTQYEAFRQGLYSLGYGEGKNINIEYRAAEDRSKLTELANELVQLKVDVIVAQGAVRLPAKSATRTIPIVFGLSGDPVEAGHVATVARPGGNMTGVTLLALELVGKRLELLKEAVPRVSRVTVLANPEHPGEKRELEETRTAARSLGLTLQYVEVKTSTDFDKAFDAISREHADGLLVFPDILTMVHRQRIAEFATKSKLPSMFGWRVYVAAGGLISYGPDLEDIYRKRIAAYVDKILKGSKPAELPVEQPTKFEFIINLKTAKQIGLTIPPNVVARADKVIK
jgi:putative tryptophan/tyrosine transport system substrate-binding protein